MDELVKKIIEKYFGYVSDTLTDLGKISPGCSLLRMDHTIQPIFVDDGAKGNVSFQEYFSI